MSVLVIIQAFLIGLVASIGLGAVTILVINRSFTQQAWSGFFSGMGSSLSDVFYAGIAFLGLGLVIDFIESYQGYIRLLVMLVLGFYGISIFRKHSKLDWLRKETTNVSYVSDLASCFALAFSNPMMVMVYLGVFAIFPGITKFSTQWPEGGIILFLVLVGSFSWWLLLSRLLHLISQKMSERLISRINALSAVILLGLALYSGISGMLLLL